MKSQITPCSNIDEFTPVFLVTSQDHEISQKTLNGILKDSCQSFLYVKSQIRGNIDIFVISVMIF